MFRFFSPSNIRFLLTDIRLWIAVFFLVRLIGITNPPLEAGHNWRQTLTCMVARNFVESGPDLLHPTIDMAGNDTGIIGSEFPFFNFLIYGVAEVFGYDHWYGRLINLVVTSIGIYFFFLMIAKITDRRTAFAASMVLLASLWFCFARRIMPDTFSMSLVIIGTYYGLLFLTAGRNLYLLFCFVFLTLGTLCKIPNLYVFAAILLVPFIREIPLNRKLVLIAIVGIAAVITGWWYFYWVPYLVRTFHFELFFPKSLTEGFREILQYLPELAEKFYFGALHSFLAFGAVVAGIFFLIRNGNRNLKLAILLFSLAFCGFILKTGFVFPTHSYYILPFIPVMALLAGIAIAKLKPVWSYVVLGLICIEGVANQQHDLFLRQSECYKLNLEKIVAEHIPENELIVTNGGDSPQEIYFAHRKGWTIDQKLPSPESIDSLSNLGAPFLVVNRRYDPQPVTAYKQLFQNADYTIYQLRP